MVKRALPVVNRETAEFDRGLGFFDAVFGFAITLLVTNIDAPKPDEWTSLDRLLMHHGFGSQLLGFAISFIVIAIFWKSNYDLLGRFTGMNGTVIIANLCTVGLVVLIPFTTQGMSDPELVDLPLPTALYSLNIALAVTSQAVMYELGRRTGVVGVDDPPRAVWAERIDVLGTIAVFVLAIPITMFVGPGWGRAFWAILIVVGPLTGRWSTRMAADARAEAAARRGARVDGDEDADADPDADPA
jgi:uncharacterized membrane protein